MLMASGHGSDGGVIMLPVAFFFFHVKYVMSALETLL